MDAVEAMDTMDAIDMMNFGRDDAAHQLIAEHITAETCVKVSAQERVVDEWKWKESRPDKHWFDCLAHV